MNDAFDLAEDAAVPHVRVVGSLIQGKHRGKADIGAPHQDTPFVPRPRPEGGDQNSPEPRPVGLVPVAQLRRVQIELLEQQVEEPSSMAPIEMFFPSAVS